jgi:hypothetical protein
MYFTAIGSCLIHPLATSTAALALNLKNGSKLLAFLSRHSAGNNPEMIFGGHFFSRDADAF